MRMAKATRAALFCPMSNAFKCYAGEQMKRMVLWALVGLVSLLCEVSGAAEWPRWRGPQNDGHVPGLALKTLPAEPKVLWSVPLGDGVGSPAVSGGKVFILDNQGGKETLNALDAATGAKLWSVALDDVVRDSQSSPGPRSTPLVDGERVYAHSMRGELQCLNVADGKILWRANYVKDFGAVWTGERGTAIGASRHGNTGAPLVDGERLIIAAGGQDGASVVCLDKKTGAPLWKSQSDVAGYAGPVVASIAGTKQYVVFTAIGVIGLDAKDGALLWRVPIQTSWGRHAISPIVVGDTVVVSSHQVGLIGVRVQKEGADWKAERVWTSKEMAINFASPVAVGNYVYGLGPTKSFFCVDARTGAPAWNKQTFFGGVMKWDYGAFLALRDNLLVLTDRGTLMLITADAKDAKTIAQVQVCGENWCVPAIANGVLFVRDQKELRAVKLTP
jgi:outer membrane protein assembly factor BamB